MSMSLDAFNDSDSQANVAKDTSSDNESDEKFTRQWTKPLVDVDEVMVVSADVIKNDSHVLAISKRLNYSNPELMNCVLKVVKNNFSVVFIPSKTTSLLLDTMARVSREVIRWEAIWEGEDPDEVLAGYESEYDTQTEVKDFDDLDKPSGVERFDDSNKEPEVKELEMSGNEVGSEEKSYDWMDEW